MECTTRTAFPGLIASLAILFSVLPRSSFATSVAYCSSENTGSDSTESTSIYQSNGQCNTACAASHPFGIILGANCWCSDYAPADTVDVSECNDACIGYPPEDCGNKDKNLYIYIRLDSDAQVKGTQGTSQATSASVPSSSVSAVASSAEATSSEVITPSATPSSTSVPSSSPVPETVTYTVTVSASVASSTPIPSPTHAAASSTLKTTSVPSSSSSSNMPVNTSPATSVLLVTLSGVVVTQTVVSTPTSASADLTTQPKQSSHVGAIVGGVIGGLALLGAIVGGVMFFLVRRRRQQQQEEQEQEEGDQSGVQRNTSTMSKSGLLGRGEKGPQYPPNIATTFGSQNGRVLDNESISPISGSDRRNSRFMFDQRLNPSAIMVLDNPSRDSFASMDDSRDYGRTLNVRNPDQDNR